MNRNYFFSDSVRIQNSKIVLNNDRLISFTTEVSFSQFLKDSYKKLEINYPKFHKMDALSKLGILGTTVLLKNQDFKKDTALVFSNRSSSHDSDLKHQQSMKELVSPAAFVYTLPNIVLGEISIKNDLQSENVFFIEENFNAELLVDYSETLLNSGKASSVVCAWLELKNDQYDVFLCLVSKTGAIPFTKDNLEELYRFENE